MMMSFKIDHTVDEKPAVTRLQEKLAALVPLRHFIVTGFSRNGLFLLIKALRLSSSDEIIIPAFTCSIIRHTIEESGVKPVPVDAEDDGLNIDPEKIKKSITSRTKAIYVVHTYGTAAQIDAICSIAKKYNLIVIEDLAHAPFSLYKGKPLGTYGDFAVFSFTKKNINFEGGAIGTNNTSVYAKMVMLQREYERKRSYSLDFFIDNTVRLVGSWWESRFTLMSLFWMKFNDFLNVVLYKGSYGIKIDNTRFTASDRSCRTTLRQLDTLFKKYRENKTNYSSFKDKVNGIRMYDVHQNETDTLPFYFTGEIMKEGRPFRLLSFRTWRNNNEPGLYPRADYLYKNYRIFSRSILLFRKK
jgi:dTDP-4-amino-4,6-dideoxygalactose transaminase